MNKTKQELEQSVVALEDALEAGNTNIKCFQADLDIAKKQLADINKPELTSLQFDNLYEAVESGVSGYDFSDQDNFDTEFELDYDNRVTLSNLDLSNSQDLVEAIVEEVHKLFTEAECPEDDNSQVNNATHVEKII